MFMAGLNQPMVLLLPPVMATAFGWMWLGYALLSEKGKSFAGPRPAVQ
jgi:hypothetical protein